MCVKNNLHTWVDELLVLWTSQMAHHLKLITWWACELSFCSFHVELSKKIHRNPQKMNLSHAIKVCDTFAFAILECNSKIPSTVMWWRTRLHDGHDCLVFILQWKSSVSFFHMNGWIYVLFFSWINLFRVLLQLQWR